jgi:hypothetical protein
MLDSINHPRNAFNVQTDAHDSFAKLTWGIEAVDDDGQVNNIHTAPWVILSLNSARNSGNTSFAN